MKQLDLVFNTEGIIFDTGVEESVQSIVYNIIRQIIISYANESKGLNEDERRKFYKLCDAIEWAIDRKEEYANLDDEWANFLQHCVKMSKFIPNKVSQRVEGLISDMKDVNVRNIKEVK